MPPRLKVTSRPSIALLERQAGTIHALPSLAARSQIVSKALRRAIMTASRETGSPRATAIEVAGDSCVSSSADWLTLAPTPTITSGPLGRSQWQPGAARRTPSPGRSRSLVGGRRRHRAFATQLHQHDPTNHDRGSEQLEGFKPVPEKKEGYQSGDHRLGGGDDSRA